MKHAQVVDQLNVHGREINADRNGCESITARNIRLSVISTRQAHGK